METVGKRETYFFSRDVSVNDVSDIRFIISNMCNVYIGSISCVLPTESGLKVNGFLLYTHKLITCFTHIINYNCT
jgi:hypothetical protein